MAAAELGLATSNPSNNVNMTKDNTGLLDLLKYCLLPKVCLLKIAQCLVLVSRISNVASALVCRGLLLFLFVK